MQKAGFALVEMGGNHPRSRSMKVHLSVIQYTSIRTPWQARQGVFVCSTVVRNSC
jgi:hypothetical protein